MGNPGAEYVTSPHNAGFLCLDALALDARTIKKRSERTVQYQVVEWQGRDMVLAKPLTYMNDSGRGVCRLQQIFAFAFSEMVLIYDDIDIGLGEIRIREKGSAGTHKGMKSVIAWAGTQEFPRLRIGIRRPDRPIGDKVKYVLTPLRGQWLDELQAGVQRAAEAARDMVSNGIRHAMNSYNRRKDSLLLEKEATKP